MILQAFIGNFSRLLTKMVEDEVGMLLGIPGEIEKLRNTVFDIQCVLSDAEKKQTNSTAIKRWLLQLKDVMYDADDLIDLCQIKADDRHKFYDYLSSSKLRCGINLLSCFHNPVFAHKIGTKFEEINRRLDEISKKKSDLALIELLDDAPEELDIGYKSDSSVVQADIVGDKIEEDTEMLVKWLTTEELGMKENIYIVAVLGMPGIGKTTLAKKVFNDPRIEEEFHLKIWVCVSKNLKEVELLKCVICEIGGEHVRCRGGEIRARANA
ncbi:Disease resistance protein (CC-NBS-LRR) [Rhynchospora pubera]|uniref:Disease resistance protein (CC-NBS-LRR) n=1 Tax=Rhynchospora pubera TaxID=906938 RepID=A0AAV8F7D8_9POAL|nr:Disease resistance protein (CC-NBS-LRR) [Rhynchospora pubera]